MGRSPAASARRPHQTLRGYRNRALKVRNRSLLRGAASNPGHAKPDHRIPPQSLRDAKGVILLDRTKAGFLFAYQGGSGVVMVRDAQTSRWSAPAFISANEASLGFQIGEQQSFVVVLLMNTNSIRQLANGVFDFGGDASGTAGNVTAGAGATISSTEPLALVYSDTAGLYGGVSIRGDALSPDTKANVTYYSQFLTTPEILFEGKAKPSQAAGELAQKLDEYSR
jgi:lipid-binding SYLF domain-containing protein